MYCGSVALMLFGSMFCSVTPAAAETGKPPLVVESYTIPSGEPGIELFVRNKRPENITSFSEDRIVLYVHGGTQASETTFDLELDGMSWMDELARHGWDVWLMDVRGFGHSTKPPEMDQPAANNPPIAPAVVAVSDVASVVEHIRSRRGVPRISLMGWSRGTTLIGLYATQNGDKVQRLVFYAPSWVRSSSPAARAPAPIGAYQTWTVAQARERLQSGAPTEARDGLMPPRWFESWSAPQSWPPIRAGLARRLLWYGLLPAASRTAANTGRRERPSMTQHGSRHPH